jgi:hypothetical protein
MRPTSMRIIVRDTGPAVAHSNPFQRERQWLHFMSLDLFSDSPTQPELRLRIAHPAAVSVLSPDSCRRIPTMDGSF